MSLRQNGRSGKHPASMNGRSGDGSGHAIADQAAVFMRTRLSVAASRRDYLAWWAAIHEVREHLLAAPVLRDHEFSPTRGRRCGPVPLRPHTLVADQLEAVS